jgi:hypothetical protein
LYVTTSHKNWQTFNVGETALDKHYNCTGIECEKGGGKTQVISTTAELYGQPIFEITKWLNNMQVVRNNPYHHVNGALHLAIH